MFLVKIFISRCRKNHRHFEMISTKLTLIFLVIFCPYNCEARRMEASECQNITTCDCDVIRQQIILSCPKRKAIVKINIAIQQQKMDLECYKQHNNQYLSLWSVPDIPHIVTVNTVFINNCEMSRNCSIMEELKRFGVNHLILFGINYSRRSPGYKITHRHLTGFYNLTNLQIRYSKIREIPEDLFDGIKHLQKLSLNSNEIKFLPSAVAKLEKLEEFDLGNNELKNIENGAFLQNKCLIKLNLSNNELKNLTKEAFLGVHSLKVLDLGSNKIKILKNNVFELLPNLSEIYLSMNNIKQLPEALFKNNKHLTKFVMQRNHDIIETLPRHFFANLTKLTTVIISAGLKTLPNDIFATTRMLKVLKLSSNNLTSVNRILFESLQNLEELDLSRNLLKIIPADTFQQFELGKSFSSLKIVNMAYNELTIYDNTDADHVFSPFWQLDYLTELNLSHNKISKIFFDWTNFLMNLKYLDLSYNHIAKLTEKSFKFSSKNIAVNLEHNQIRQIQFHNASEEDLKTSFLHDTTIFLDHNPIECNCYLSYFLKYLRNYHEDPDSLENPLHVRFKELFCSNPTELAGRRLTSIKENELLCDYNTFFNVKSELEKCPTDCQCWIRINESDLLMNCSNLGLLIVPTIPVLTNTFLKFINIYLENNYIKTLPKISDLTYQKVRNIYAFNNSIESLESENIPNELEALDLRKNNLKVINKKVLETFRNMETLKNIQLSGNPWKCDCTAFTLIVYIQNHYKTISDFDKIKCVGDHPIHEILSKNLCSHNNMIVSLSLAVCGILLGVMVTLYYKYQQEIKIWMYWHNICTFIFNSDTFDANKKYDAFISYSHKDEDFVTDILVPELERRRQFNLCIHRRDWTVGDFIPDQIFRSVDESRRTIIVLSPNYVESVWGTMEFRIAHHIAVKENVSRIIIIIYSDLNTENLDKNLKAYLDMNTYIRWGDPWFWERLHYALKTFTVTKSNKNKLDKSTEELARTSSYQNNCGYENSVSEIDV